MGQEQGPHLQGQGTIPRLSHLPMPRAPHDSLRLPRGHAIAAKEDPIKPSALPRPSRQNGPVILGESANSSIQSKYGWNAQSLRIRSPSPVRDALRAAQASALETTPPSADSNVPVFEDGDENPSQTSDADVAKPDMLTQRRRPRPSLSERTIETLAQISPSPSPTRRRSSVVSSNDSSNGRMGPPQRPASSMRTSRSATPLRERPASSVKQPFRPPGRSSPTKEQQMPAVPSPGSLYTPPKVFLRGGTSRIAKPSQKTMSASVAAAATDNTRSSAPKYSSQTVKGKSSMPTMNSGRPRHARTSLESIFKDPGLSASNTTLAVKANTSPGLLRPRLHGENIIAKSPAPKPRKPARPANTSRQLSEALVDGVEAGLITPKSSATLRETISKAKAARKAAADNGAKQIGATSTEVAYGYGDTAVEDFGSIGSNTGLLRKRIQGALSSGQLNIAALQLDSIPSEVMNMYETGNASVIWAEMVDLIKLNAADNRLTRLDEGTFPDWSFEEMADDEEKTNQFGGLQSLDLHNNMLSALPLGIRRLERLTALNLSGNQLSNESLETIAQLPNLHDLNLSRNKLKGVLQLTLLQSTELRNLNVRDNQIDDILVGAQSCRALQRLDVSKNRLTQLPWKLLASAQITELNASNNKVSGVAFEGVGPGFERLISVDLSSNALEGVAATHGGLSHLKIVNFNNNSLKEMPNLSLWKDLTTLQISGNRLCEMPQGLEGLTSLKTVDVSQNGIKVVRPEIAHVESLTALDLGGNPLRNRKYLTMGTADLKEDLARLFGLSPVHAPGGEATTGDIELSRDGKVVGGGSPALFKPVNGMLDLSSKSLSAIDPTQIELSGSLPVHTLRLSNNELTMLPFELLSHPSLKWSLKSLDISHNPLLPTEHIMGDLFLPKLQSLYIVSTGLASLDSLTTHLRAPELKELNISCHRLSGHLPWIRGWFPQCTSLLATDNWFSSIDVEGVRGLEVLDVKSNEIEVLPAKMGLLGNHPGKIEAGKLRMFECGGNRFRVPRLATIEKGTEAVLKDLRRMVPSNEVPEEWKDEM